MKILFIAHYFQPEPGFFFALPFARALRDRGHQVEVITGYPNYPSGKLMAGYRQKLKMVEWMDGIKVTRVPLFISHDRSSIRRILSYSTLSASQALIGTFCSFDADIAFVSQGPATIGLSSVWFKWLKRIPFVYQIQDLWPDSLSASGMFRSEAGLKLVHWWCRFVYSQSAHIAVIAPGMKQCLMERGVPGNKISVIYNCGLITDNTPSEADVPESLAVLFKPDCFNILYAGNLGPMQKMETVVEAAGFLRNVPDIRFILLGNGVETENLKQRVQADGLNNVLFHPFVRPEAADMAISRSSAVLTHLQNISLFNITIPSKIQKYLSLGKPVIAAIGRDAARMVVDEAHAGISAEPENARQLADAALELYKKTPDELRQMGENGKSFYRNHLSFEKWVDQNEKLFLSLVNNRK